jgi:integrase/recombinase XerC
MATVRGPVLVMPAEVAQLCAKLPTVWASFLRDWDRTLRAGNYPVTTRYNYLLAVAQFARYVTEYSAELGMGAIAHDPPEIRAQHLEAFQAWMIETRSASTALNKHKALQQFFKWLVYDAEEIDRSPMERVRAPRTPQRLIPVLPDDDTRRVLDTCRTKSFVDLRDAAIIRLFANTGARLSEVGNLHLDDVDLNVDAVRYRGKGDKERRVRIGPRAARAISRYLRARAKHTTTELPQVWLAARGQRPLAPNGIKLMLKRRGVAAGLTGVHAHRWRHNFAHEWKLAGGDTGDLMLLMGWSSDDMARHYGASAAAERAQQAQLRIAIGDDV